MVGPTVCAQLTILTISNIQNPMLCNGPDPPIKVPLPMGMHLQLTHGSLGSPDSESQMTSGSVQPFFAQLT